MFVDDAIFGMARTGKLGESITYPQILNTSAGGEINITENELIITPENIFNRRPLEPVGYSSLGQNFRYPQSEDIVLVTDGLTLLQRPRKLLEAIASIRKNVGYSKLIYLQGVGDPYLFPVLVYAGISLFDDSTLRLLSLKGIRYGELGYQKSDANYFEENMSFARRIMSSLAQAIKDGTLREVVEKYQISTKASEILRLIDSEGYEAEELLFPRRTPYIMANSLESLRRPDLVRYRNYIENLYRKPPNRKVALLIPCSARKPYSSSKSHRKIIDRIAPYRKYIHEIIVTSPVGLVPRELEASYPARFYDIPVIGDWYEDEKQMIRRLIRGYFRNNGYDAIYTFVGDDLDFIHRDLPAGFIKITWDKRTDESLDTLYNEIKRYFELADHTRPDIRGSRLESYIKIAEYQFGDWISDYLTDCKIVKNYNSEMLVRDGKPFLVYNPVLGKFTINKNSAEIFIDEKKFLVEIDDFRPTANIYPVGIMSTTEDIRQEDEVVIHHAGEVRAVGIAKMPFQAMRSLKKGVAIKVRN